MFSLDSNLADDPENDSLSISENAEVSGTSTKDELSEILSPTINFIVKDSGIRKLTKLSFAVLNVKIQI